MKYGILSEHKSLRFAQEAAERQRNQFNIKVRTKYLQGLGIYRNYNYGELKINPRCPICGTFLSQTKPGWHGTVGADLAGDGVEWYCKKGERNGTH